MPSQYCSHIIQSPDQLLQWLDTFGETPLFALADVQVPGTVPSEELDAGCWGPTVNLYEDLQGTAIAKVGPRLIEVANEHRSAVVEQVLVGPSLSLLLGNCRLADLVAHLQAIREVMVPDEMHALFRYQDPHVIAALFPIIKPRQGSDLLGPLTAWAVLDTCHRLHILSARGEKSRGASLRFDQKIVDALNEQLFVHTVTGQVRDTDSSLLGTMSACEIETELRARIATAKALGLDQRSDQSLYCVLSFQFPEGFEKEAPFAEALRYRERGHSSFGAALDKVTPDVWNVWDERLAMEE